MTGFLLAACAAAGVALIWLGIVMHVRPVWRLGGLGQLLAEADIRVGPIVVTAGCATAGAIAGLGVSVVVDVPVLAIAAGAAGAWTPVGWARRRREHNRRERERAWPAALAQLADAMEAGIAFPAAVAFVAESGPVALRGELRTFVARVRSSGMAAAVDGLERANERAADTVVLLLRAGLVDLPAGGLAPVLRELADILSERFEAREKARSRASSLQVEAAILALSPIALLLLVGIASPAYLDAYKTPAGTVVALFGGAMIYCCYATMRRLGRVPEPRRTRAQP
jgi:tight adherence protein B